MAKLNKITYLSIDEKQLRYYDGFSEGRIKLSAINEEYIKHHVDDKGWSDGSNNTLSSNVAYAKYAREKWLEVLKLPRPTMIIGYFQKPCKTIKLMNKFVKDITDLGHKIDIVDFVTSIE